MDQTKRHFLVVAAASRGARFFIKKALREGHDVTGICRAEDDQRALERLTQLLEETKLADGGVQASETAGKLNASNSNIVLSETYKTLLEKDVTIDAVCCFVGVKKLGDMLSHKHQIYTKTVNAIVEGMRQSRWAEMFFHSSSGSEGIPGENFRQLPENYSPKWLLNPFLRLPAVTDILKSEEILAKAHLQGMNFVIFRPAFLTKKPAQRQYGYCFDTTGLDKEELPLRNTTMSISREDVAEEILRVATLPAKEREKWHGHGVYLADMKKRFLKNRK
jgi:nucleoside-diphosphate-sugar epimerase